MGENIRDVIARVQKAREEQAKQKAVEKPKPKEEVPIPDRIDDFSDIEAEYEAEKQEKPAIKPQESVTEASKGQLTKEQQIMMEIEMLQNDGRFRAELLSQLQDINKALVVIADALVELFGHGK
jgi:hypothetical protein